jgi:imidazole glycerol phosphate synthase subunit HisF
MIHKNLKTSANSVRDTFFRYDAVQAGATILLAASVFHFNIIGISDLKDYLKKHGVSVR